MLSHSAVPGSSVELVNSRCCGLLDAIASQAIGARQYSAPTSMTSVGTSLCRRVCALIVAMSCLLRERA